MGGVLSLFKRNKKILILGAPCAGKTTVFDQIAYINRVKPKIAARKHFNFVKISHYQIWDLAGENNSMYAWPYYYDNTACIVFVYDSQNAEASERTLRSIVYAKELRSAKMLIVVNKFVKEGGELERIGKIIKTRQHSTIVVPNNQRPVDIKDGFDWIVRTI
ncbi:ADP-ribosylation factor-like protein 1 [Pancytospora philotis]|nr:ADP-ribosylation factor-like protein 1 [Pancytospora philotis]